MKTARMAQMRDGDVVLSWQEALALAERAERTECELDNLKRDVEQIRILKCGVTAKETPNAPKHVEQG
jgi:hypothetical protein